MYLLADVNSMYASCEQIFRPDLKVQPVVVLSNNDGAVVAMNKQAKALNIKRGAPYFQIKPLIQRYNVTSFSSNYALYGDMSSRVMATLESLAPRIDIYSIDEAFLHIDGIDACEELNHYGHRVRDTVKQVTGLTCGIGISSTYTLSKLANYAAKRWTATNGVVVLTERHRQRKLMSMTPVEDVWGIGRNISGKLKTIGITTALQLADANLEFIKKIFGVVVERTVRELNGTACISIEAPVAKQQIICSRSFGERVTSIDDMRQAICQYAERAAEKLRQENQYCRHINIFIRTSPFSQEPFYSSNANEQLMLGTNDTRTIISASMRGLNQIWRDGYRYQKAGIILNDFCTRPGQLDLFDTLTPPQNSENLMRVIDRINSTGIGKIWFGGQGIAKNWKMKREMLSPSYTTNWNDLPSATIS